MADKSKTFRVKFVGDDKALRKTFHSTGNEAASFGKRCSLAGKSLRSLVHGDFKSAGAGMKGLGKSFGTLGLAAGTAFGAIAAGAGIAGYTLKKWIGQWGDYAQTISKINRFTGLGFKPASQLAGQFKITGISADKAAMTMRYFARNLYAAQQGTKSQADNFKALGVELKDNEGRWRSGAAVLTDTQRAFSELEDPIARTALMMRIFGKSGGDLARWLSKDSAAIAKMNKLIRDMDMFYGDKQIQSFKDYEQAQRDIAFMWDSIKFKIAAKTVPWIVDHMQEIQGGFMKIRKGVDVGFAWFEKNGPKIADFIGDIGSAFKVAASHGKELAAAFVIFQGIKLTSPLLKAATWTAPAGGVGRLTSRIGGLTTAFGLLGGAMLAVGVGDFLGGKAQGWMDKQAAKLNGQGMGGVKADQKVLASRFGGKAALTVNSGPANATIDKVGARWRKVSGINPKLNADNKPSLGKVTSVASRIGALGKLNPKVNVDVTDNGKAELLRQQIATKFASTIWQKVSTWGGGGTPPDSALGGVFSGRQLRYIGEDGPEAIVPLSKPRRAAQVMRQAGLAGGAPTVNVSVNAPVFGVDHLFATIEDAVSDALGQQQRYAAAVGRGMARA